MKKTYIKIFFEEFVEPLGNPKTPYEKANQEQLLLKKTLGIKNNTIYF